MKAILLKRKEDAPIHITKKVIADDIVTGMVANYYYIPVLLTSAPGIVFLPVQELVENYLWPIKNNVPQANIENFLRGHNPNLAKSIDHYEDDSFELELNEAEDHK